MSSLLPAADELLPLGDGDTGPGGDDSAPDAGADAGSAVAPHNRRDPDSGSANYAGPDGATGRPSIRDGLRELSDARDIRALAHPTRLALLEALTMNGPLTATEAAAIVGESPSSCSFHLRSLAKHGYVEETGDGAGRNRPWRMITFGTSLRQSDLPDKQSEIAAKGLGDMYFERQLERLQIARANRSRLPAEWIDAQSDIESILWVTAAELRDMNDKMLEMVMASRDRLVDPSLRPEGAQAVELLYFTYRTSIGGTPDPYLPVGEVDERSGKKKSKPTKSKSKSEAKSEAKGEGKLDGGRASGREGGRKGDRD